MPEIARTVQGGIRVVERSQAANYGKPGVRWCPFCDTSSQMSVEFPNCPKCSATFTDVTEEEHDRLVNPPLVDKITAAHATAERLRGESAAADAMLATLVEEREEQEPVDPPADEPGASDIPAPEGYHWPSESSQAMEEGKVLCNACGRDISTNPGALAGHRKTHSERQNKTSADGDAGSGQKESANDGG